MTADDIFRLAGWSTPGAIIQVGGQVNIIVYCISFPILMHRKLFLTLTSWVYIFLLRNDSMENKFYYLYTLEIILIKHHYLHR